MRIRRFWAGLFISQVLFILYCTLYPFFFPESLLSVFSWQVVRTVFLSVGNWTPGDVLQNILLFLPLGYVGGKWITRYFLPQSLCWAGLLAFGFGLSFFVEMLQQAVFGRFTSFIDVVCNVTGTGVGYWISRRAGLPRRLIALKRFLRVALSYRWAVPTLAVFFLLALEMWQPFNFVLDWNGFLEKWGLLFSQSSLWSPEFILYRFRVGFIAALGTALLCAWLVERGIPGYAWKVFVLNAGYALFLEGGQLIIRSRVPSLTDLSVQVGAGLAGLLVFRYIPQKNILLRVVFWSVMGGVSALLVSYAQPGIPEGKLVREVASQLLPGNPVFRLNTGLHYLSVFFFLGFLGAYMLYRMSVMPRRTITNTCVFAGVFLAILFWTGSLDVLWRLKRGLPVIGGLIVGLLVFAWLVYCFSHFLREKSSSPIIHKNSP